MSPFAIPRLLAAVSAFALVLAPVYLWLYGWLPAAGMLLAAAVLAWLAREMCREVRRTRRRARIVNRQASAFGLRVDAYRASVDEPRRGSELQTWDSPQWANRVGAEGIVVLPFARRETTA